MLHKLTREEELTKRQREIIGLAAAGLKNREIAARLSITEGTVKLHLHNIYGKLGIDGRTALAVQLNGERG